MTKWYHRHAALICPLFVGAFLAVGLYGSGAYVGS